ncbi:hypothetical protein BJV78DRAFT_1256533, partial [Lactifluus subvellereus]
MSSPMHEDDLRFDVNSGLNRRIKAMVAANGGQEKCIGKASATGLGVHIIFLSEQSPGPTTSPRPATRTPREEEDIEMVDSSESSAGSDIDTAEQHTPRGEYRRPSSTLNAPRAPRRTEDRRLEDWNRGNLASIDGRVVDSMSHITKRWPAPRSDLKDVEAARQRVEVQRLAEAKKIRIEQLMKRAQREAQQLRQRAADLERETAEDVARLLREEMETDEGEGEEARSRDTEEDGDGDKFDVQSNGSYTLTEVYSTDDGHQPRWSSPFPSPPPAPLSGSHPCDERSPTPTPTQPQSPGPPQVAGLSSLRLEPQVQPAQGPLRPQSTMPLAHLPRTTTPPRGDEFVVVTRQVVDGLDDLTGSHVRH